MMMMKTDPFTFYLQVKGMVGKRVVGKRGTSHDYYHDDHGGDDDDYHVDDGDDDDDDESRHVHDMFNQEK